MYGAGPGNAESAIFYGPDGLRLKTGTTIPAENLGAKAGHDLPRSGQGANAKAKR